jgi:acetylornithine/succinyldiaminopimelate/putrescine aminotransferase
VRGRGLLLGLEFERLPEHLVTHWHASDPSGIAQYMVPGFPEQVASFYSFYVMQTLLNSKGIYSQLARSNPYVLRIEPPLTITQQQADQIVKAISECCIEMEYSFSFLNSMIVRSTMGKHDVADSVVSPQVDPG